MMAPQHHQEAAPLLDFFEAGQPVSGNHATGRRGRRTYATEEARVWRAQVMGATAEARLRVGFPFHGPIPLELPLRIRLTFWNVRGDADNYAKTTLDGLKWGLAVDDRHFAVVEAWKVADKAHLQGVGIEVWSAAGLGPDGSGAA